MHSVTQRIVIFCLLEKCDLLTSCNGRMPLLLIYTSDKRVKSNDGIPAVAKATNNGESQLIS